VTMSEPGNDDQAPRPQNMWVLAGELTAIAFELTGSVLAGVVLGYFADLKLGTEPWLLIGFTLLGTGAGFYRMIKILQHMQRRQRRA
jgi:ATP synthase protein I